MHYSCLPLQMYRRKIKTGLFRGIAITGLLLQAGLFHPLSTSAQLPETSDPALSINACTIHDAIHINEQVSIFIDTNRKVNESTLNRLVFDTSLIRRLSRRIPTPLVGLPYYCKFTLTSTLDTPKAFYFFPGYYFRNIALFKDSAGIVVELLEKHPPHGEIGCRLFVLPPHSSTTFYFRGSLIKSNTNWMDPILI